MDAQNPTGESTQPMPPSPQKTRALGSRAFMISLVAIFIAAGLFAILSILQNNARKEPASTIVQTQPKPPLFLSLDSPNDSTLVTDGTVMIKGKTLPNTTVVFFTQEDENSVESDTAGNFSGTLAMANGINTLTITAYGQDGEEKRIDMDVVYDELSAQ